MYQTILFDLDGTLTDSSLGITNSVAYALEKMGITVPPKQNLLTFIGPPLAESFQANFGLSEETVREAIALYREYFAEKGIYENQLYPDVLQTLKTLKEEGKTIILATSKPEPFARIILDYFELSSYFDEIVGASLDGRLSEKGDVIREALHRATISEPATCLMVGDRKHDIIGAHTNHMNSVGVLYGFGSKEELQTAGATYLIQTLPDILKLKKD
ncbi:HAD family hydrolase [Streptococcus cameli]